MIDLFQRCPECGQAAHIVVGASEGAVCGCGWHSAEITDEDAARVLREIRTFRGEAERGEQDDQTEEGKI